MATVKDIAALMEELAPRYLGDLYCEKYGFKDNSGLLIGDENKQVFSVLVCLDVTGEVASEACDLNTDIIITHHPLMYNGIKSIIAGDQQGRIISKLIKNDIAVYAAHINFDVAPYGVNQILADRLGLSDCKVIQPVGEDAGLGRIGILENPLTLRELVAHISGILNEGDIRVSGDMERTIKTVAVAGGACGGDMQLLETVQNLGAELFITSEIKHHVALAAKEMGLALIDGGHYSTEYPAVTALKGLIESYAADRNMDIEVTESSVYTNPFI